MVSRADFSGAARKPKMAHDQTRDGSLARAGAEGPRAHNLMELVQTEVNCTEQKDFPRAGLRHAQDARRATLASQQSRRAAVGAVSTASASGATGNVVSLAQQVSPAAVGDLPCDLDGLKASYRLAQAAREAAQTDLV